MGMAVAGGVTPPPVERDNERRARNEVAHIVGQDDIAGDLSDGDVERGGQPDRLAVVAGPDCRVLMLKMRGEIGRVVRLGGTGGERRDPGLDEPADLEYLSRLARAGLGDEGSAIGFETDQPVVGECLESGAHDGAADSIDRGEFVLWQLHSRLKAMTNDRVAERAMYCAPATGSASFVVGHLLVESVTVAPARSCIRLGRAAPETGSRR